MKELEKGREWNNRKDYSLLVIEKYVGELEMLDTNHILSVDQEELKTVIPQIGGLVKIVNGAYRGIGSSARLVKVDTDKFSAKTSARLHNESLMMQIKGQTVESNCKVQLFGKTAISYPKCKEELFDNTAILYSKTMLWIECYETAPWVPRIETVDRNLLYCNHGYWFTVTTAQQMPPSGMVFGVEVQLASPSIATGPVIAAGNVEILFFILRSRDQKTKRVG
ncbi:hypothetical protein C5167_004163 [Papaver somniferum]|nr:hypothetical protein C5167_004163 [Papaver somniferum]